MAIVSVSGPSVADLSRDEVQRLRDVLRSDDGFPDEAPPVDAIDANDRAWWYQHDAEGEGDFDAWLATAGPEPYLTITGRWSDDNGSFGWPEGVVE